MQHTKNKSIQWFGINFQPIIYCFRNINHQKNMKQTKQSGHETVPGTTKETQQFHTRTEMMQKKQIAQKS